jgi:murein DD-endopeptidase MepM/ murein hydrolase activator NlpD
VGSPQRVRPRLPLARRFLPPFLLGLLFLVPALAAAAPAPAPASIDELRSRLDRLQEELDDATFELEAIRTKENQLRFAVAKVVEETRTLQAKRSTLEARAVSAARRIYMSSGGEALDVLLSSESVAEIASRSHALSHISESDHTALMELQIAESRLATLKEQLVEKADDLTATRARLEEETADLQTHFDEVTAEYVRLKRKLAARARARAKAVAGGTAYITASGMTCPIAGPNSFIDSWGFPRDGGARTHEGTDMMAEMGAPVVAITDGRITYAGVGATAGNWLELEGDDGHTYWYMHNEKNLITGGKVTVGQQIATVGNTGNAAGGPPHVHFEYHPNGDGPVNPYSLLVRVCRTGLRVE